MLLILFQPDWEAPGAAQRVRSGLSDSSQDLTYTLSAKDLCLSWFGDCLLVLLFFFFFPPEETNAKQIFFNEDDDVTCCILLCKHFVNTTFILL